MSTFPAYLTAQEIAEHAIQGIPATKRGVAVWLKRGGIVGCERAGRGGGYEYPLSSLPEAAQMAVIEKYADTVTLADAVGLSDLARAAIERAVARRERPAMEELPAPIQRRLRRSRPTPDGEAGLVAYKNAPTYNRKEADRRFAIMQAFRAYHTRIGGAIKPAMQAFCEALDSGMEFLPEEARGMPFSARSLLRWHTEMKRAGVGGLLAKHGNRKNCFKISEQAKNFVISMVVEYPHAQYRMIEEAAKTRFEAAPPYDTIRAVIKIWKEQNKSLYLFLTNPDEWKSRHAVAFGSKSEDVTALNQRWEMDSTKADLILADGRRHVIVGVIDIYSRRMKLHVSLTSSSAAVTATLRRAILDWGKPQEVVTDNGSDYVSKHMVRVAQSLGIEQYLCDPFQPQQKPFIERHLGTLSHSLMELLPGYVGHSVADRKAIEARKSFAQRLMHQGETIEIPHLDAPGLQEFCDLWTEKYHANRRHRGLNGRTPLEMVATWADPVERVADERALDMLLCPAPKGEGTRVFGKKGIQVGNRYYIARELAAAVDVGEEVEVRIDESDLGRIFVFGLDGRFIAVAEDPSWAGISRKEEAVAARRLQKDRMNKACAVVKKQAKEAGLGGIYAEIIANRAEGVKNVAFLPRPAKTVTTPALEEAGKAAKVADPSVSPAPSRPETPRKGLAEIVGRIGKEPLPESRMDRYRRAKGIEAAMERGEEVPEEQRTWLSRYQQGSEYRAESVVDKLRAAK
ncbi:MAG: transposase [Magnetococcales bacterium]|nr:transposase [Magnetococcales bacterium]